MQFLLLIPKMQAVLLYQFCSIFFKSTFYAAYRESSGYDGPDLRCFEVTNAPHKMENAPGHPAQLEDFYHNVKVVYLPSNTTALLQPMDL